MGNANQKHPRIPGRLIVGTLSKKKLNKYAETFAALGDKTRLQLVAELSSGRQQSISTLTECTSLTRQAVTKHLNVLEEVGIVHSTKVGRESLYELDLQPFKSMEEYLEFVSSKWDQALARLKNFVE